MVAQRIEVVGTNRASSEVRNAYRMAQMQNLEIADGISSTGALVDLTPNLKVAIGPIPYLLSTLKAANGHFDAGLRGRHQWRWLSVIDERALDRRCTGLAGGTAKDGQSPRRRR